MQIFTSIETMSRRLRAGENHFCLFRVNLADDAKFCHTVELIAQYSIQLESIFLTSCDLGHGGVDALVKLARTITTCANLRRLCIENNHFGDDHVNALLIELKGKLPKFTCLDVDDNQITDGVIHRLVEFILSCPNMDHVHLCRNLLTDRIMNPMCRVVVIHPVFSAFHVWGNAQLTKAAQTCIKTVYQQAPERRAFYAFFCAQFDYYTRAYALNPAVRSCSCAATFAAADGDTAVRYRVLEWLVGDCLQL